MNVLYLHTSIWCGFFSSLLKAYADQRGCATAIICPDRFKGAYADNFQNGTMHFLTPDAAVRGDWEDDPEEVRRLTALVAECEQALGRSFGRFLLACERTLGAGFSYGAYFWPGSPLRNACLADSAQSSMAALRIVRFMEQVFDTFKPDLVISRSFNQPEDFVAQFFAARAGVAVVGCRFSKAIGKRAFWTDDYLMYNTAGHALYEEYTAEGRPPSDKAVERIEAFRIAPRTVDYIADNWANAADWYKAHSSFLGMAKAKVLYRLRGQQGQRPLNVLPKVYEFYRKKCLEKLHAKYFETFTSERLASMRYVYYPLHKEPELMLNYSSPLWHDQLHAVRHLAAMLPAGHQLLVREHRFNWGRRNGAFLKTLTAIPNVTLVDPFDPQFKYIKNASLVVTDNGSTGWEALLMRRRLVTLEQSFYTPLPQSGLAEDPRELDRTVLNVLSAPPAWDEPGYDEAIGRFLDAEYATTDEIEALHADMALSMARIDALLAARRKQ